MADDDKDALDALELEAKEFDKVSSATRARGTEPTADHETNRMPRLTESLKPSDSMRECQQCPI